MQGSPINNKGLQHKLTTFIKQLSIRSKIIIGFTTPILLLSAVSLIGYINSNALIDSSRWVYHTQDVINRGHQLEKLIVDMETGERGFLITGNEAFLEPFLIANKSWGVSINNLKQLVKDNPQQVIKLDVIDSQKKQWIELAATPEINQRRKVQLTSISLDHLEVILQQKIGKRILDDIRLLIEELHTQFTVAKNQQGVNLLVLIMKDIIDQETGERGFLITGDEPFLEPYKQGGNNFKQHVSQLKSVILKASPSLEVLPLINRVESLEAQWLGQAANPAIDTRRATPAEAEFKLTGKTLAENTGKHILDELKANLRQLETAYLIAQNETALITVLHISKAVLDQEAAQRQFLMHGQGQDHALLPFTNAQGRFKKSIKQLKIIAENAYDKYQVLKSIEAIEDALHDWHEQAAKVEIATRRDINQRGLAPLEQLQRIITLGAGSQYLVSSKQLIKNIEKQLAQQQVLEGRATAARLSSIINSQEAVFLQLMLSGKDTQTNVLNQGRLDLSKSFIELLLILSTLPPSSDNDSIQRDIEALRTHLTNWHYLSIEPALKARQRMSLGRSNAFSKIQYILKQGIGKAILDQSRALLKEIRDDFNNAHNLSGYHLALEVEKSLVDQETGQRGFIITGDESFLKPYVDGYKHLQRAISALTNIANQAFNVNDSLKKIDSIDFVIKQWLTLVAEPAIALRHQVNADKESFKNLIDETSRSDHHDLLAQLKIMHETLNSTFTMAENQQAQRQLLTIQRDISRMKAALKGFLMTGQKTFLLPYTEGKESVENHLARLRQIVITGYKSENMLTKVEQLRLLSEHWREQAGEPEIELRRKLDLNNSTMRDVTQLIEKETGKHIIDAIRRSLNEFILIEETLIKERSGEMNAATSNAVFQTITGILLSISIAFLSAYFLLRDILSSLQVLIDGTVRVSSGDFQNLSTFKATTR